MTYIINPMWIFWFHTLNSMKTASIIFSVIFAALALAFLWLAADEWKEDYIEEFRTRSRKFFIAFAVLLVIGLLIPGEETCVQMMAATLATKENIALGVEGLKELILFIVEALK